MTNTELSRAKRELKPFQRPFLTVACLGLLSSCGGSGSGGNADTATAQDATKQIAAVSGGTVPAGWAGRVPELTRLRAGGNGLPIYREGVGVEDYEGGQVVKRELLITVKPGITIEVLRAAVTPFGWKIVSNDGRNFQLDISSSRESLRDSVNRAKGLDCIRTVSPNFIFSTNSLTDPLDSELITSETKWHFIEPKFDLAWHALRDTPANKVTVGIIDGGFRFDHEDLSLSAIVTPTHTVISQSAQTLCLLTEGQIFEKDSNPCLGANHGMNVAGIIGATGNNTIGSTGVAYGRVNLIGFRANKITSGSISNGINYLIGNGAKIINLSMGLTTSCRIIDKIKICDTLSDSALIIHLENFIDTISDSLEKNSNVVFVQSAGNSGNEISQDRSKLMDWKTGYFTTIASGLFRESLSTDRLRKIADVVKHRSIIVGAYESGRKLTAYTNRATYPGGDSYIVAPGGHGGGYYTDTETNNAKLNIPGPAYISNTRYVALGGTSQAAPHVSGLAALVLSANPSLSAETIKKIIIEQADTNLSTPYKDRKDGDGSDGYRYLNAEAAVREALERKKLFSDDFNGSTLDTTKWIGVLPWNSTGKNSTMLMGSDGTNNYMRLVMTQTDTGGNMLSPSFPSADKIRVTYRHRMHAGNGYFFPAMMITNETAAPENDGLSALQNLAFKFKSSAWSGDNVCALHDIPRVEGWGNDNGCVPMSLTTTKRSSSLFDKFITTIVTYDSITGAFEFDLEGDGIVDISGVLEPGRRFKPSRIAFTHFGWFTGHEVDIDSVKVEAIH